MARRKSLSQDYFKKKVNISHQAMGIEGMGRKLSRTGDIKVRTAIWVEGSRIHVCTFNKSSTGLRTRQILFHFLLKASPRIRDVCSWAMHSEKNH